ILYSFFQSGVTIFSLLYQSDKKLEIMKKLYVTVLLVLLSGFAFCQSEAIKVVKEGTGNPILFLPGFTTPGSVWMETAENLEEERERHLVSYAGFNGIEPIDTPWYSTIKKEILLYI